ncbi:MAG: NAD-dependent epimerase/dehydratase family protein [Deltaproteobacteria bacterium]|nr:NAD-dependent epimerase/dehydratase family protein [Deltaproteobacteria bacterium]
MKILVTGSTGFLGHHLIPLLQNKYQEKNVSVHGVTRGHHERLQNLGLPLYDSSTTSVSL